MTELANRCTVCSSVLDEEDLFCPNCGTAAPHEDRPCPPAGTGRVAKDNFQCKGCGASMSYDASAQALRCPFCGSVELQPQPFDVKQRLLQQYQLRLYFDAEAA